MHPVELMRWQASQITAADPTTRLQTPATRDEIHRLATTLNEMLDRLAQAAVRERAFVANASHELRTPVAAIRAELELATRHATTLGEFRAAAAAAITDADDLARMADDLLMLERAEAGSLILRFADVDVDAALRGAAAEAQDEPARGDRGVKLRPSGLHLRGDPRHLGQALSNMVRNAVLHGRGTITLGADRKAHTIELWVSDAGQPLPPSVAERAFERFARAPEAIDRPGSGLGLAIVREIAHAHGGEACLINDGRGVSCVLALPIEPQDGKPGFRKPADL